MGFSAGALANISMASQVAGGVTSAFGAYTSASGQRANLNAQARIAESNARISELGAQAELRDGQQRVAALTMRAGQLKGSQRAALAANGVALDTGSAAEVQQSGDVMKEMDRATLETQAARAAFGQRMQATNQRSQAAMARANASAINPAMAFGTSLLGSAGSVAESWYRFKGGGNTTGGTLTGNGDPIWGLYQLNNGWR